MNILYSMYFFQKPTFNRNFGNISALVNLLDFPVVLLMSSKGKKGMALHVFIDGQICTMFAKIL